MASDRLQKNGIDSLIIKFIIILIIGIIVVAGFYYSLFDDSDSKEKDNLPVTVDTSDAKIDMLLKHISLIDPLVQNDNLVLYKDLSDERKLQLVIEELLGEKKYISNKVENPEKYFDDEEIIIESDDILKKALAIYDLKTYDYYPDSIEYYNYLFTKEADHYVGRKTKSDNEFGKYVYEMTTQEIEKKYLYLTVLIKYYETNDGAYEDSNRSSMICEGKGCINEVSNDAYTPKSLHITYKIVNSNFVFVSASVANESQE